MKSVVPWIFAITVACTAWAHAAEPEQEKDIDPLMDQLEKTLEQDPQNPKAQYNLGTLLYHQGEYHRANEMLSQALAGAGDALRQRAAYNLGNTRYRRGRIQEFRNPEQAIQLYQDALKDYRFTIQQDPEDRDAQFNYELTRNRLEALKQQQEQASQRSQAEKKQEDQEKSEASQEPSSDSSESSQADSETAEEAPSKQPETKQGETRPGSGPEESMAQGSQQGPPSEQESAERSGKPDSESTDPSGLFSEQAEWILDNYEREERKARSLQQIRRDEHQGHVVKDW